MIDVSVVVPCTDRTTGLQRAIKSVLRQSFSGKLELILVENNSNDMAIVKSIVDDFNDSRIRHYYLDYCENANVARNYGADCSSGRYVAFLDSDDEWDASHIESCLNMLNSSRAGGVYSGYALCNGFNTKLKLSRAVKEEENAYDFLFGRNPGVAQTSSYFLRSEVLQICRWDEGLKRNQDYDFFISVFNSVGWVYLGVVTTTVYWEEGVVRGYSLDSFREFYFKHSPFMVGENRAYYLLEVIKALSLYSKDGYDEFKHIIADCRDELGMLDRLYTYNYYLAGVLNSIKSALRKFIV